MDSERDNNDDDDNVVLSPSLPTPPSTEDSSLMSLASVISKWVENDGESSLGARV